MGGGDEAAAYRVQEEREEGEDSEHVTGACSAVGGSSRVGPVFCALQER